MDQKFTSLELDHRDDGEEIQSILNEITGARTVSLSLILALQIASGNFELPFHFLSYLFSSSHFTTLQYHSISYCTTSCKICIHIATNATIFKVPRVFVKGECLGGGSDVKALYEQGELQKFFA